MEALSNYSALLWLEKKKRHQRPWTACSTITATIWLRTKDPEGRTLESAGPIVWGVRLESSGIRDAWRVDHL